VDEVELATLIRVATLRVPGVLAISKGIGYREATYGPGATVDGVGVSVVAGHAWVNVHVIVADTPIPRLSKRIRRDIRKAIGRDARVRPGPINVYIDDIVFSQPKVSSTDTL
jgi:uncharacterized alkaline shock family protein YloU